MDSDLGNPWDVARDINNCAAAWVGYEQLMSEPASPEEHADDERNLALARQRLGETIDGAEAAGALLPVHAAFLRAAATPVDLQGWREGYAAAALVHRQLHAKYGDRGIEAALGDLFVERVREARAQPPDDPSLGPEHCPRLQAVIWGHVLGLIPRDEAIRQSERYATG